jgi:hypothetical protein
MKKIYTLLTAFALSISVYSQMQNFTWDVTSYKGAFPVTDNTPNTDWTYGWANFNPNETNYPVTSLTIENDITSNTTLQGVVLLKNKVYVKNNSTLTILPGTIIRGDYTTQGTLIVTKGSKIIANGTESDPIVFTSNQNATFRAEGDWGGLVLLGKARNNQPGGVAYIEGITQSSDTEYGGNDDHDNSGSLKYVRIEFAGIPLEPNKEINGLTFGSVGDGTIIDYIQVSHSGDDSYEWFGGTVNCKHLISYSTTDDDFDTDFGYRGNVQFGLGIRNPEMYDAAGESNGFESDNDANGSDLQPKTMAVFSNFTLIGPKSIGTLPGGETFGKSFRLRRNTSLSVFNTLTTGWDLGLSIEGSPVELNVQSDSLIFSSNILSDFTTGTYCVTATPDFYTTFFSQKNNDSISTINDINWVNLFQPIGTTPDARLMDGSVAANGADFTSSKFMDSTNTIIELNETTFSVYPNPSVGDIKIEGKGNFTFVVYNSLGSIVSENNGNLTNLNNGVYFVSINNGKDNIIKKFIIKK